MKDGVNCVEFKNDLSDFKDKILHYKNNPDELDKITANAVDFFHNNWTWEHRAADLIKEIEQVS